MERDSAEPPIFTKDTIRLNGRGPHGGQAFLVKRADADEAAFCKTDGNPYDACVAACLVVLRDKLGFEIRLASDDLEAAEALVNKVLEM